MSTVITIEEWPSTRRLRADEMVTVTTHEVVRITVTRVPLGASSRLERELAEFVSADVKGFVARDNLQIRVSPELEAGLKQVGIDKIRQWIEAWAKSHAMIRA